MLTKKQIIEEIKQFISYAEREGVVNSDIAERLTAFIKSYIRIIE